MKKLLILSESYPSKDGVDMAYVHSRALYYRKKGIGVEVICFKSKTDYLIDGVQVWSELGFKKAGNSLHQYDLVISHAPNLKNHFRYLLQNQLQDQNLVFVIHGHEVLKKVDYYPLPFSRLPSGKYRVGEFVNRIYDFIKVKVLKFLFRRVRGPNVHLIFVSQWMRDHFCHNLQLEALEVNPISSVIPNPIHEILEQNKYESRGNKVADFVAIRPFDNPKYCVDVIVETARRNPELTFHLYGKGSYFDYYEKPENLTVFNKFFAQSEIPEVLNQYRAAIMPTRLDSQGVMMCEMASYGIPIVVSNLDICHEMMDGFQNVHFIDNDNPDSRLKDFLQNLDFQKASKSNKFLPGNTVEKELELFRQIIARKK